MQHPEGYIHRNASLAVDGNNGSDVRICAQTNESQTEAYWNVTFDKTYLLKGVVIINGERKNRRRRLIRVNGDNGVILHQHDVVPKNCTYEECPDLLFMEISQRTNTATLSLKLSVDVKDNPINGEQNTVSLTLCEVFVFAVVRCPLIKIPNGQPLPESYEGANTMVKCQYGHRASIERVTCLNSGEWNDLPKCDQCDWNVDNGYIVDNHNNIIKSPKNGWINVICNLGYWLGNKITKRNFCVSNSGW
ncbi:uncharacterized protein LOC128214949 isoform X2 [Mya arenaria]|nr:uncharacterized protein LOC128214949 isoform X2 [Mya arenaria]